LKAQRRAAHRLDLENAQGGGLLQTGLRTCPPPGRRQKRELRGMPDRLPSPMTGCLVWTKPASPVPSLHACTTATRPARRCLDDHGFRLPRRPTPAPLQGRGKFWEKSHADDLRLATPGTWEPGASVGQVAQQGCHVRRACSIRLWRCAPVRARSMGGGGAATCSGRSGSGRAKERCLITTLTKRWPRSHRLPGREWGASR